MYINVLQLLQQMEALDVRLNDDIEYFLKKYKENGTGLFMYANIFVVWLRDVVALHSMLNNF